MAATIHIITHRTQCAAAIESLRKQYANVELYISHSTEEFSANIQRPLDAMIFDAPFGDNGQSALTESTLRMTERNLWPRLDGKPVLITCRTEVPESQAVAQAYAAKGIDVYGNSVYIANAGWQGLIDYSILLAQADNVPAPWREKIGKLLCTRHGEHLDERIATALGPNAESDYLHGSNMPLWEQDAYRETIAEGDVLRMERGTVDLHVQTVVCSIDGINSEHVERERRHEQLYLRAFSFIRETLKRHKA